jgi:hypothetical protein
MQFSPDLADAGSSDSPNRIKHRPLGLGETTAAPNGRAGRILVEGTWNAEILRELTQRQGDLVVPKHRSSGFFETNLDSILRARGIRHLIVTGCTIRLDSPTYRSRPWAVRRRVRYEGFRTPDRGGGRGMGGGDALTKAPTR